MKRCSVLLKALLLAFACVALSGCQDLQIKKARDEGPLGPQSTHARGELRVLTAVVRFPDAEPTLTLDQIRKRTVQELDQYVREQSYGLAWVKADFRGGVFVGAENETMGMFAHDFFHALGGVQDEKRLAPCLYDFDRQSEASQLPSPENHAIYIGPWDIMSEHFVTRNDPLQGRATQIERCQASFKSFDFKAAAELARKGMD